MANYPFKNVLRGRGSKKVYVLCTHLNVDNNGQLLKYYIVLVVQKFGNDFNKLISTVSSNVLALCESTIISIS